MKIWIYSGVEGRERGDVRKGMGRMRDIKDF